jgi:hypothetical protein
VDFACSLFVHVSLCNDLAYLHEQIFYFEWMDFGQASLVTDLVPKIAAYTMEKIRDLIKLDSLDKKRTVPIYC